MRIRQIRRLEPPRQQDPVLAHIERLTREEERPLTVEDIQYMKEVLEKNNTPPAECPGCGKRYYLAFPKGDYAYAEASCEECGTTWQVQNPNR